jgi:hypothetical protein
MGKFIKNEDWLKGGQNVGNSVELAADVNTGFKDIRFLPLQP